MSETTSTLIEQQARLRAIASIASALMDGPPADTWHTLSVLHAIATGDQTIDQARRNLGEGWESL